MAEVTIYNALQDATDEYNASPSVVFISDTTGYAFYINSASRASYKKTTDGGANWGSEVTLTTLTGCGSIAVWYDQWTPGDTTGTKIHITYAETVRDGAYYRSIDTASSDAQSTEVDATGDLGIWGQGDVGPSICKATDGDLFIYCCGSSTNDVFRAASGGTSFASTTASFLDDKNDQVQLIPLASGAVMLILLDDSAGGIYSRIYSGAGSWAGSYTTIDATVTSDVTYPQSFSATILKSSNDVYLIYNNTLNDSTGDVRSALYNGSWTIKTNVTTNVDGVLGVSVAINMNNSDVYALYVRGTALSDTHVYYKVSTDDMATWGAEQQLSTTLDDMRFARTNSMSNERLYGVWYNDDLNDLLGNTIVDIVAGSASSSPSTSASSSPSSSPSPSSSVSNSPSTSPSTSTSSSPSSSPSPSSSVSNSPSSSPSSSPSPSSSVSNSPSTSPSTSVSSSPSSSPSPSSSRSTSPSSSPSSSPSPSSSVSNSPSTSPSTSVSNSPSSSPSPSSSASNSPSTSPSSSPSPSSSVSNSPSTSPSTSTSSSPSSSPSPSSSVSDSPSTSPSSSPSPSSSVSNSPSSSPSTSTSSSPSTSPSSSVSSSPSSSPSPSSSASDSPSTSPSSSPSPSSSVSSSPSTSPSTSTSSSPSSSPSPSSSVSDSPSTSPSSSVSSSPSSSPSPSSSSSSSVSSSPSSSPSPSSSVSNSPSTSPSNSPSTSPSSSPSTSPSSSVSASPSAGYELYTRGNYAALPGNDADLETNYSGQDYADVDTKNDVRVAQLSSGEFAIHQFKDYVGAEVSCTLEWEGQTDGPPSASTVYLQIYNQNTTTWETVDSDSTTAVDTDFILTANVADLTNYKTPGNLISCRVYQEGL